MYESEQANAKMAYQQQGYGLSGSIGGALANQPVTQARQIPTALEILDKEISAQAELLEMLNSRLGPLMSLEPPSGEIGKDRNIPTTPMANRLDDLARGVSRNSGIISSLLRRLEV